MAVSKDKIRILVTISRETKIKLEKIAESENRSVSNYIATLIQKDIEKKTT